MIVNAKSHTEKERYYYVKLPGKHVYLTACNSGHLGFSEYLSDAKKLSEDEALKIAKEYLLEVEEVTVTTTTQVEKKVIFGQTSNYSYEIRD